MLVYKISSRPDRVCSSIDHVQHRRTTELQCHSTTQWRLGVVVSATFNLLKWSRPGGLADPDLVQSKTSTIFAVFILIKIPQQIKMPTKTTNIKVKAPAEDEPFQDSQAQMTVQVQGDVHAPLASAAS